MRLGHRLDQMLDHRPDDLALEHRIKGVEARLYRRRTAIRVRSKGISDRVRTRMTSPGALAMAGLFGVILARDRVISGWKVMALVRVITGSSRLWSGRDPGGTDVAGSPPPDSGLQ